MQFEPQSVNDSHHRGELGIPIRREGLVEPFPGQPGVPGELRHAARPGYVTQGRSDQAAISRVLLEAGLEVEAQVLLGVEVVEGIPSGELDSHLVLLHLLGQFQRGLDVLALAGLVPPTKEDHDLKSLLDEIDPIPTQQRAPEVRGSLCLQQSDARSNLSLHGNAL